MLTAVDKQELLYKINNLPFIQSIEDNVVVDEFVWENMNALLMTNPNWIGVSIYSPTPGKFVLRGYLQTLEQVQRSATTSMSISPISTLENQVVDRDELADADPEHAVEKGFSGVTFQLSNGELVLAGRVDQKQSNPF